MDWQGITLGASIPSLIALGVWNAKQFVKQEAGPRGEQGPAGEKGEAGADLTVKNADILCDYMTKRLNGRYHLKGEVDSKFDKVDVRFDRLEEKVDRLIQNLIP